MANENEVVFTRYESIEELMSAAETFGFAHLKTTEEHSRFIAFVIEACLLGYKKRIDDMLKLEEGWLNGFDELK